MCIAILKPAGEVLSKSLLQTCFDNNPDGAGFAYINTDHLGVKRIKIYKSMTFDPFYNQYLRATRIANDSTFLVHFRIKTHGKKDIANCHPFMIDHETVFIHNGIISGVSHHPDKSDTRMFNEEVLQGLPEGWMTNPAIEKLIEDFIGMSKLCVLNIDNSYAIYNDKKGHWYEGSWMSNDSYKDRVRYSHGSTYKGGYNSSTKTPVVYNQGPWTITAFSKDMCEYCNDIHQIKEMHVYEDGLQDLMIVCDKCKAALEQAGAVNNKMKTTIVRYLTQVNIEKNKEDALITDRAAERLAAQKALDEQEFLQSQGGYYN